MAYIASQWNMFIVVLLRHLTATLIQCEVISMLFMTVLSDVTCQKNKTSLSLLRVIGYSLAHIFVINSAPTLWNAGLSEISSTPFSISVLCMVKIFLHPYAPGFIRLVTGRRVAATVIPLGFLCSSQDTIAVSPSAHRTQFY